MADGIEDGESERPLIAVTAGDPAGIGPEVIVGAWREGALHRSMRLFVVGNPEIMRRAARLLGDSVQVAEIGSPEEATASSTSLPCLPVGPEDAVDVRPGAVDPRGGQAAYEALMVAADLALAGKIDALTTGPLNKEALWKAGHHYPGHTELLAKRCGVRDFAMMLYLPQDSRSAGGLGVVHVTLHMALSKVFSQLTTDAILEKILLAQRSMAPLCGGPPRIGVCALNPHGGEAGLFGDEEIRIIAPAVARATALGALASGPFPTDTLMVRARDGEFDAVIAMYHDQGHIALKLLGMHRAVNVTLGLPIVRTSVAHGTAFDLAWQGRAQASSMVEALKVAGRLTRGARGEGGPFDGAHDRGASR